MSTATPPWHHGALKSTTVAAKPALLRAADVLVLYENHCLVKYERALAAVAADGAICLDLVKKHQAGRGIVRAPLCAFPSSIINENRVS